MPTVREMLAQAIPHLSDAGVDSPRLDAELLLAHVLRKDRRWLWTYPDYTPEEHAAQAFDALLARRLRREPLAYLLGEWEFYGRTFMVSPAVLVPRPETELLVEAVLVWAKTHAATRIADIGVGSGAIAVTLAAEMPTLEVIAVDLSPQALLIARRNADTHGVSARITFLEGNLLLPIREGGLLPMNAVVANLPYIAEEEMPALMPEVRDYEPRMALAAEEGGLALIRRLIAESPSLLTPGGLLAMEVGIGQAALVADILAAGPWRQIRIIDDYAGIPRHVLAELQDEHGREGSIRGEG